MSAELLLISGGILDLFPLSGVATPFLSYGRTAMLANFLIAGILLALGREQAPPERTSPFHAGLRWVQLGLALLTLSIVAKAGYRATCPGGRDRWGRNARVAGGWRPPLHL